jgi:hypothetical protein
VGLNDSTPLHLEDLSSSVNHDVTHVGLDTFDINFTESFDMSEHFEDREEYPVDNMSTFQPSFSRVTEAQDAYHDLPFSSRSENKCDEHSSYTEDDDSEAQDAHDLSFFRQRENFSERSDDNSSDSEDDDDNYSYTEDVDPEAQDAHHLFFSDHREDECADIFSDKGDDNSSAREDDDSDAMEHEASSSSRNSESQDNLFSSDRSEDESDGSFFDSEDEDPEVMEQDEAALHDAFVHDFHDDVNHFPPPEDIGSDHLLSFVNCAFDVDSIYFIGQRPSSVLMFMGEDGTCDFHSAINRIHSTSSSRISVDYRGVEHLMPNMTGRKVKRLKVVSLQHFPNISWCL